MRNQILYYAWKYHGEWKRIAKAIRDQEKWEILAYEGQFVTIVDNEYPESLRMLEFPPWILFYEGDWALLERKAVAVIGSRKTSFYGKKACEHVVSLLKKRYVIVSGVAKGIDSFAHQEALDHYTIGIIGCGLDISYPKENSLLYQQLKKNHLVISEYPKGVKPLAHHFPWRNRLIAALSSAIVVIEANIKSGTMLTVNEGLILNKSIYCIPHAYFEEQGKGCNLLISQGAYIIVDDQDIEHI